MMSRAELVRGAREFAKAFGSKRKLLESGMHDGERIASLPVGLLIACGGYCNVSVVVPKSVHTC